jgi:hypothetical protein
MIGFIGLRVGWLFFLDEFGPIMAYILKIGFIVAGIFVWRSDDREAAVQDDEASGEPSRAWVPVMLYGALVVGVIAFITVSILKDRRLEKQLQQSAAPAVWAVTPANSWPDLFLLQKAEFAHHSSMEAGCACLVRLPTGDIVALTAGHLLGKAGGVSPGFTRGGLGGLDRNKLATLTTEITSWTLFLPDDQEAGAKVTGLYGEARTFDENCDQILLQVSPDKAGYPVTPLDVRMKPVTIDEPLRVVAIGQDRLGNLRQMTYNAKRIPGLLFTCALEHPVNLNGCSGAPVVDKDGLLVGIVTSGPLMDLNSSSGYARSFSGRTLSELLPVLKAAVAQKGIAPPSQAKAAVRPTRKVRPTDDQDEQLRATSKNSV